MTLKIQVPVLFLCAAFVLLMIPGDAKDPQADEPHAEVVESIAWGPNNQSIQVYAWERGENVWRYGALQGAFGPNPSVATLEEYAHGFDTIEALAAALPKDRLIMMPITQIKVPGEIRAKMHKALSKHKVLFLGGC